MSETILGISAFYHDAAACLLRDGQVVAASQEERFSRKKHDAGFPFGAVEDCLRQAGLDDANQLDKVVFYDKPIMKFERLLVSHLQYAPFGLDAFLEAMPVWLKDKLWVRDRIRESLEYDGPVLFTEHHQSHAASAFFPSPFESAAILTVDGVGEWTTASIGRGDGNQMELLREIRFPHSLGLLYSAFTGYLGFTVNSAEYKVMGLAPYGTPKYADIILEKLIDLKPDGSFHLDMSYFDYGAGLRMTNERFWKLFDRPPRTPESDLTQDDMDIAASVQLVTEEAMLNLARAAHELTELDDLVLAGGVALNCVANGRILREGPFSNLWIQPAAGDAGGALGAALFVHHQLDGHPRKSDGVNDLQSGSLLGPAFSDESIGELIAETGLVAERFDDTAALGERVAEVLDDGNVVGWFQGRMEFGPRSLGARSILGDPRRREMQEKINLKIKFRESFRPFAPAVLEEHASEFFELDGPSSYMLLVAPVAARQRRKVDAAGTGLDRLRQVRSVIPAVTHVDDSARIQTVGRGANPAYRELLEAFHRRTGCPVLVNTSMNVRGEPIVCTPYDAYRCFMRSGMDALALGPYLILKSANRLPTLDVTRFSVDDEVTENAVERLASERREVAARRAGYMMPIVFCLFAALSFGRDHTVRAGLFAAVAAAIALYRLLSFEGWKRVFLLGLRGAKRLSQLVTAGLLTLAYYGLVTPYAFVVQTLGKMPLDLGVRDDRESYWSEHETPEPSHYREQG